MQLARKQAVFAGVNSRPCAEEEGEEEEVEDDEGAEPEEDAELTTPVFLLPWEHPERFWKEVLNSFGPEGKYRVVDFTPGSGVLAIACCRAQIPYLAFAHNVTHKSLCVNGVKLQIVKDVSSNTNDGFLSKRCLSKAASLTGEQQQQEKAATKTKVTSKSRTTGSSKRAASVLSDSDSDSSESS